eukprot:TRINITY_DN2540_c0_g2_i1.p2 TRINITY_DN2540_c0_g2~~TRINITY_DN2540_c0_g2_i1.p2  ORF type:complete len:253 (+),score=52.29 TRINITY_DN2540_c0_g2_i1:11-769(+)
MMMETPSPIISRSDPSPFQKDVPSVHGGGLTSLHHLCEGDPSLQKPPPPPDPNLHAELKRLRKKQPPPPPVKSILIPLATAASGIVVMILYVLSYVNWDVDCSAKLPIAFNTCATLTHLFGILCMGLLVRKSIYIRQITWENAILLISGSSFIIYCGVLIVFDAVTFCPSAFFANIMGCINGFAQILYLIAFYRFKDGMLVGRYMYVLCAYNIIWFVMDLADVILFWEDSPLFPFASGFLTPEVRIFNLNST